MKRIWTPLFSFLLLFTLTGCEIIGLPGLLVCVTAQHAVSAVCDTAQLAASTMEYWADVSDDPAFCNIVGKVYTLQNDVFICKPDTFEKYSYYLKRPGNCWPDHVKTYLANLQEGQEDQYAREIVGAAEPGDSFRVTHVFARSLFGKRQGRIYIEAKFIYPNGDIIMANVLGCFEIGILAADVTDVFEPANLSIDSTVIAFTPNMRFISELTSTSKPCSQ